MMRLLNIKPALLVVTLVATGSVFAAEKSKTEQLKEIAPVLLTIGQDVLKIKHDACGTTQSEDNLIKNMRDGVLFAALAGINAANPSDKPEPYNNAVAFAKAHPNCQNEDEWAESTIHAYRQSQGVKG